MNLLEKANLREAHVPHWTGVATWTAFAACYYTVLFAVFFFFQHSLWVPLVLAELLLAHLMHFHVIAFHEATHQTLVPNKILNEILGEFIGIHGLMGLALFRVVHGTHHAYLATDRDEELWPFADSSKPLWFRRLIVAIELSCGLIYTPVNFLRGFLRSSSSFSRNRMRVYAELAFIATSWAIVLYFVGHFGVWGYFLVLYLIPAGIAANMQNLRKYIEHMGLFGDSAESSSRTIAPDSLLSWLSVYNLFNIGYHSVHHRFPKIPQDRLAEFVTPENTFPNYRSAFLDMVRTLPNPQVGVSWSQKSFPDSLRTSAHAAPCRSRTC